MTCHALTQEISELRHHCLPVFPRITYGTALTCLQQQLTEHKQRTFASRCTEKERKYNKKRQLQSYFRVVENNANCKAFCVRLKNSVRFKAI